MSGSSDAALRSLGHGYEQEERRQAGKQTPPGSGAIIRLSLLAGRGARFFVPLGVGAHLEHWGVPAAQIEELEWWQQRTVGAVQIVSRGCPASVSKPRREIA